MTPEQERECERLKALLNQRAGMTQREFVKKYDLGSPSNLGQYLASSLVGADQVADQSPRVLRGLFFWP